jgi:hypothetical protein
MSLREEQSRFALMVGKLIVYAYGQGFEITFGDIYPARFKHKANGQHPKGLAIDLNLFKQGEWLSDGTGHDILHDYWDSLGGSKRIMKDLNHYSVGE